MLLAAQGRHEALEKLVNVQGCIINNRTGSTQIALHCAAGDGRVQSTDVLYRECLNLCKSLQNTHNDTRDVL